MSADIFLLNGKISISGKNVVKNEKEGSCLNQYAGHAKLPEEILVTIECVMQACCCICEEDHYLNRASAAVATWQRLKIALQELMELRILPVSQT
ncbi:hypothetical protein EDS67_06500 [candidate division KSB1 bacterium]|nr:MAG: hypothetical protein EDS67_06500 [candidate division KSB1 bacterium]MBC6947154.1 hypothetical protein [candidate division KSB1 bacterium]MCE7941239.1 hypothetical protein [Chlorobi bacterium CHB1]MDL1875167.1 hypothetical protein [Cytophagia bacterium CHB2]